jgi:DNA replication protein DnaC
MSRTHVSTYQLERKDSQEEYIINVCNLLGLAETAASFRHLANSINNTHGTLFDFLEGILEKELLRKEENRIMRWVQQARFSSKKTIDEFNFSFQPDINPRQIKELASCRYIREGKNIVFLGPPGVGKTHLSIGLGMEAIYKGFTTKFLRLDELIDRVDKETDAVSVSRIFKTYSTPQLLILDDIDFYVTGINASAVLFKLISTRDSNRLSTIFTSNKPFSEWKDLFGNHDRASAALDRIVGNSIIVKIEGESYRVKDKMKKMELELSTLEKI